MMKEKLIRLTRRLMAAGVFMLVLVAFFIDEAEAGRLVLPAFTSRIEQEAFFGDDSLVDVVLNEGLKYIGPRAFANSGLRLVTFPGNSVDIASDAFDGCEALQALVTPGSWAQQWCEEHNIPWIIRPTYSKGTVVVKNGASVQVELDSAPAGAQYVWSSDNESVMKVDKNGRVSGEYPGTATLTLSLPGGGELLQIPVQVQANYRAALFSESTYYEGTIMRNRGDVRIMSRLLASVTGPDGGKYSVSTFDNLVSSQVFQKITDVLETPSRDGDVSLFFFASHGDPLSADQQNAGRLWCVKKETWVALQDLAAALLRVKGKVIVILEACGPGAAIHNFGSGSQPKLAAGSGVTGETEGVTDEADARDEEITAYESEMIDSMVSAFRVVEPSLAASSGSTGNLFLDNGEKFVIMCAAGYMEYSKYYYEQFGDVEKSCNVFPYFIGQAVGTSGAMPADTNGDGILTLKELHVYVYNNTFSYTSYRNSQGLLIPGQKPVAWPENSSYPLFVR